MALGLRIKRVHMCCLMALMPACAFAEGIVDVKPYLSTSLIYDDNVFRFSSPQQAKAAFGIDNTSDTLKSLDLGLDVNLRLSRQLVTATLDLGENQYSRFKNLDNTSKSFGLRWDWRIATDVYGTLSTSENEAVAGFNETRSPIKNFRTTTRQYASINWDFLPDWTVNASREWVELDNSLASSKGLDRQDDIYEAGVRYHNRLDTELGVAYRVADSTFPNRQTGVQSTLGQQSSQESIVVSAAWLPTAKIRLSTQLSQVSLSRVNSSLPDLSGFSQHWNLDYLPTEKLSFNLSASRDVSPVDDVLTTYVRTTGFQLAPSWRPTSKITVRCQLGYSEQTYLGSASLNGSQQDRVEDSILAGLSLIYTPTLKSLLQLQYQGEKRNSTVPNLGYRYNNTSLTFRYNF